MHKCATVVFVFLVGYATSPDIQAENALGSSRDQRSQDQCYQLIPVTYRYGSPDRSKMCQALEESLNRSCDEGAMICGLHFPADATGFSTPDWRELSIEKNKGLLERLVRGHALRLERFNPGISDRAWNLVRAALNDPERRAFTSLKVSKVDVFNRDNKETVYRLTLNSCSAARSQNSKLDPSIYMAKQAEVLNIPEWRAQAERGNDPFPGANVLNTFPVDFFTFEGEVFEFRWSPDPWVRELSWHESDAFDEPLVAARTACKFKYLGDRN